MSILVALSEVSDKNMLIYDDKANPIVVSNRKKFLHKQDISLDQTTRLDVTYEGQNFLRYYVVGKDNLGDGMYTENPLHADGFVTKDKNHALFLPLADCVGTVLYDPVKEILMLSHLGRHSIEQNGGYESVAFLKKKFGCEPSDLFIWLAPAPGADVYPLYAFENRSFKEVVYQQLLSAGVIKEHITDTIAETDKDARYYSHSEFLQGRADEDGRHSIVAMMT
jgi:copper oxidase (laccase) domain-containing protein